MKLEITVDLQDIFDCTNEQAYYEGSENQQSVEGYDLNEHIKNAVINGILEKVSKDCLNAVMKEANEQVNAALSSAILKAVNAIEEKSIQYAESWLLGDNIKVTDKWGEVKETVSINDVITRSYENTLNREVDRDGRFTTYNGTKLIDYISQKHVIKIVEGKVPNFDSIIDKAIKEKLDEQTTNLIARKIKSVIGE